MQALNDALARQLDEALFITAVAARIEAGGLAMQVVSAGHLGPFVRRGRGGSEVVAQPGGPPLGLFSSQRYGEVDFRLEPHDVLLFATDGVTDQFASPRDHSGQAGLLQRLSKLPARPSAMCRRLLWTASPAVDVDATVLAVQLGA
jgi:serine phosphatase RsbU (regulator of sigma subunit)